MKEPLVAGSSPWSSERGASKLVLEVVSERRSRRLDPPPSQRGKRKVSAPQILSRKVTDPARRVQLFQSSAGRTHVQNKVGVCELHSCEHTGKSSLLELASSIHCSFLKMKICLPRSSA